MTIHHHVEPNPDLSIPDPHQDVFSKNVLGFWIYLMTDCLLFGTLFATYAVLQHNTFGGPGPKQLFSLPEVFIETMVLLFSSLTCGLALLSRKRTLLWLLVTFLLGLSFIGMELREFAHFIAEGNDWTKSAFLSSFFALVGTHGLHVTVGLLWILVMMGQVWYYGVIPLTFRRLVIFSLFWHFLDLIWIFVFTFVYLLGVN